MADGPKWPLLIAIAALVLIGAGVGLYFVLRTRIPVPQFRGRTEANADSLLEALESKAVKVDTMLPSLPVGFVVNQDPDSGKELGKQGEVRVVLVSDTAVVPEVKGKQANIADTLLEAVGFKAAPVDTPTADPPGLVLDQTPKAGARWPRSTPVRLLRVTGQSSPAGPGGPDGRRGEEPNTAAGLVDTIIRMPQLTGAFGTVIAVEPATGQRPARSQGKGHGAGRGQESTGRSKPDLGTSQGSSGRPRTHRSAGDQLDARIRIGWPGESLNPRQDSVVEVNTEVAVAVNRLCKAAKLEICDDTAVQVAVIKGMTFTKKDS